MSSFATLSVPPSIPADLPRHRFSIGDYQRMIEVGILTPEDRVELLFGEIVPKMSIGPKHSACLRTLLILLTSLLGNRIHLSSQCPIRAPDGVPDPDLALLKPRPGSYADSDPAPEDVLLVIEIAESSLRLDRGSKALLYACAGIQEYWIVNLIDRVVEVYREPSAEGCFKDFHSYGPGESIKLVAFPEISVSVADILPAE